MLQYARRTAIKLYRLIKIGPSINNEGLYTNAKGTIYLAIPTLLDSTAVAIGGDFAIAQDVSVPPQDSYSIVGDGRLVLETSDILKIKADSNSKLNIVLSILETAKQ